MNNMLLGNMMPNVIYKRLLDNLNKEPIRKHIVDKFHSKFNHVWLTLYGDIIVAVEIEHEAIFILQEGVFRYRKYINNIASAHISLNEYLSNEYIYMSISTDVYTMQDIVSEHTQVNFPIYTLEPLIICSDDDKPLSILDNNLSTAYLNELYTELLSYYSLVKENNKYLDLIQSQNY